MTHALAIDTTSDYLSLGIVRDDQLVESHYALCGTRIARTILPEIERLLDHAGLKPDILDVFIVNRGPGSFTGTRIGMSVALTLGKVLGKPVIGVDSLKVLAAQVDPSLTGPFHVLLNCARDEVYYAAYQWQDARIEALCDIRLTSMDLAVREAGDAPSLLRRFNPTNNAQAPLVPAPLRQAQPDANCLVQVGLGEFAAHTGTVFETPAPIYLKSEALRTWRSAPGAR
jgi:tRNA threonylcarbamoyl adenosine modification protein YeaZ